MNGAEVPASPSQHRSVRCSSCSLPPLLLFLFFLDSFSVYLRYIRAHENTSACSMHIYSGKWVFFFLRHNHNTIRYLIKLTVPQCFITPQSSLKMSFYSLSKSSSKGDTLLLANRSIYICLHSYLFITWLCRVLVAEYRIQFPDQGWNLGPLRWQRVATGPPGKSLVEESFVSFTLKGSPLVFPEPCIC